MHTAADRKDLCRRNESVVSIDRGKESTSKTCDPRYNDIVKYISIQTLFNFLKCDYLFIDVDEDKRK